MWIEISTSPERYCAAWSRPARALWIEIVTVDNKDRAYESRPARALWIEILVTGASLGKESVEAREGLVD